MIYDTNCARCYHPASPSCSFQPVFPDSPSSRGECKRRIISFVRLKTHTDTGAHTFAKMLVDDIHRRWNARDPHTTPTRRSSETTRSRLLSVSEKIPRAANITLEFVLRDSQNRDRRGRQASILGTSRHRGKQHASGNDGAVTFGRKKVEVVVPLLTRSFCRLPSFRHFDFVRASVSVRVRVCVFFFS